MTIQLVVPLDVEELERAKNILYILLLASDHIDWSNRQYCSNQDMTDHLSNCGLMISTAINILNEGGDMYHFPSRWADQCIYRGISSVQLTCDQSNNDHLWICLEPKVRDEFEDTKIIAERLAAISRPGDSVDANSNFEAIDMADELAGGPEWDT